MGYVPNSQLLVAPPPRISTHHHHHHRHKALRTGTLLRFNAFAVSDKEGVFTIGGSEYPCQLMDLPGIVESYKTYNDVHLVKSTDVGQVNCTYCSAPPPPLPPFPIQ